MKQPQHMAAGSHNDFSDAADSSVLCGDLPTTARLGIEPARQFATRAVHEYQKCLDSRDADGVPSHLPRASGLLFGNFDGNAITISDIEFVSNVRDSDASVMAEFEGPIATTFGDVYKNPGRGFWCDEEGVLQAVKRQVERGRELMGSIHSHPDWHDIGPRHERAQRLSENPTQMDHYLFRQSCWPINVIWYISSGGGDMAHRVAGWRPGLEHCDRLDIHIPPAIHDDVNIWCGHRHDKRSDTERARTHLEEAHVMTDVSPRVGPNRSVPTVTIKLPAAFHALTGGRRQVPAEGENIREVLVGLGREFPGVLERIMDQEGSMRRYVNIHRNDNDIRSLDGLDTRVENHDVIWVIPAVAGG